MQGRAAGRKLLAKRAAAKRKVQPIPAGYGAVTPYLAVRGAAQAIEFCKKAFGAKELMRMPGPEGKLGHVWHVVTHKEDLPMAVLKRRAAEMAQKAAGG